MLATGVAGCGRDVPHLPALATDATVLAFGDSLTSGVGATPGHSYPEQLQQIIGRKVVNGGISGDTTAGGRERLPAALDEHRPALVILCLGGNDLLRKHDRAAMRANLDAMIREIKGRGIALVLLGVPRPTLLLLDADPMYEELAAEHRLPLDADVLAAVLGDSALKSDQIHANDQGYRRIAEAVAKLLKKARAV